MKLAAFWEKDAAACFTLAEAVLGTSLVKYHKVILHIPHHVLARGILSLADNSVDPLAGGARDIQHVPEVENIVADALSRPPALVAVVPPVSTGLLNWAQRATGQATCEDLAALRTRQPYHLVAVQVEGFPVWCDVSA